jgi:uncharacterized protein (DUF58 family)
VSRSLVDVLGRVRTPAEPGPGPVTAESLRALDLEIGRRVDGLLAGEFRSAFPGLGTELHQIRPYEPGDDVRRIDWNVTARTGQTHVRVELAEHTVVTWLVLDASTSMAFGTADRRKADVAEGVVIAMGHVGTRRGNRLGMVAFGAERHVLPPRQGRRGLLLALGAVREAPSGTGNIGEPLNLVSGLAVERSLVVVISDFRGPRDWQRGLLRVASRHATLAIEIRDPREEQLAEIGELHLVDPETGEHLLVDTQNPVLREQFAEAAAAERQELVTMLNNAGVLHVAISTEGDWLTPLATFLTRSGRR